MYNDISVKDFKKAAKEGMKALYLDCETSPMLVYTHYIGNKVSIHHPQIKETTKVMCVQFKWEGDKQSKYMEWDKVNGNYDDSALLEATADLVNSADLIIGQNIDSFDMKVLLGRMAANKLTRIKNDVTIDILKLSKKSFRLPSYKLDHRSKVYGGSGKDKMEFQDWIDIVEGKVPISKKMGPYGCKDVDESQRVFYAELDYYKKLPTLVVKVIRSFLDDDLYARPAHDCTHCGGHLISNGVRQRVDKKTSYRWLCRDCGRSTSYIL